MAVLLVIMFLLMAGIVKCWALARRPGWNPKCVAALLVVLFGWLVYFGNQVVTLLIPLPGLVVSIVSFTAYAILLSAGVLAVVGLSDISRDRGSTKGRAHAIIALLFAGFLAVAPYLLLFGGRSLGSRARNDLPPERLLVFEEANFRFLFPGGPWQQIYSSSLAPDAKVAVRLSRPDRKSVV